MEVNLVEANLINRIVKTHLVTGSVAALFSGVYFGIIGGVAVFAGTLWGAANLYAIKLLIVNLFNRSGIDFLKALLEIMLKFPLIYLAGFGLLMSLPYQGLLLGFSLQFAAMLILLLTGSLFAESKSFRAKVD